MESRKGNDMRKKERRTYEQDISGDGIYSLQKVIEPHRNEGNRAARYVLIGISMLFLGVMLVLPLVVVVVNALREGWEVYKANIFDAYTIKAFRLTVTAMFFAVAVNTVFGVAAAYLLSKFYFRGRSIVAALIDIPFSISRSLRD